MTPHIDHSQTSSISPPTPDEWLPASAEIRDYLNKLAARTDLIISVAPDPDGSEIPAYYVPATAEIYVNTTVCLQGVHPEDVRLDDKLWRLEHAAFIGAAGHEAGHAAHTRWTVAEFEAVGAGPKILDVVMLLEEPRCEHRLLQHVPRQKLFLRAAALELILRDFTIPRTPYGAAAAAALVLGRVDGGTMEKADGAEVRRMVGTVLPDGTVAELEQLWREFLEIGDRNLPSMYSVAKRWLRVLEEDPNDTDGILFPGSVPHTDAQPQQQGQQPQQADDGWLRKALGGAAVRADGALVEARGTERAKRRMAAEAADAERRQRSQKTAAAVFGVGSGEGPITAHRTGERNATVEEQQAATILSAALLALENEHDPEIGRASRQTPPGRLRTRSAAQAAAYKDLGIRTKPDLFRGRTRTPEQRGPLSIGLLCDISGSMQAAERAISSAHWILSHAGSRSGARIATVHFGAKVHGIARVGQLHERVQEYRAGDPWERFSEACLAIDHELDLLDGPGTKVLVIASDAQYGRAPEQAFAEGFLPLCKQKFVAVVWLDLTRRFKTNYGHGRVLEMAGAAPVQVAEELGRVILSELRKAGPR